MAGLIGNGVVECGGADFFDDGDFLSGGLLGEWEGDLEPSGGSVGRKEER